MNTDRFLTRVYDKEEKKMLYSEPLPYDDSYTYTNIKTFAGHEYLYRLIGINQDFINFITKQNVWLPYHNKGRFVPMMCLGANDMIKQIIYEDDLIMIPEGLCQVKLGSMFNWHFSEIKDTGVDYMITPKLLKCSNVMGNKWENPEILEANK